MSMKLDPVTILDWLAAHELINGAAVYTGSRRYRDAYAGNSHKAIRGNGYLYCIDKHIAPPHAITPLREVLVVTEHPLDTDTATALARDLHAGFARFADGSITIQPLAV